MAKKSKKRTSKTAAPSRSYAFPALVGVLIVAFAAGIALTRAGSVGEKKTSAHTAADVKESVNPRSLPGIQTGEAPWAPEYDHLAQRLNDLGLPPPGAEQLAYHIHQHIDIFVHGKRISVPAGIGFDPANNGLAIIHTHDDDGTIHVESPFEHEFTLGHFFDVWGVLFTKDCLGGYCNKGADQLRVYINGKPLEDDPTRAKLTEHLEILVTYGTQAEEPNPIPSSYDFAPGE